MTIVRLATQQWVWTGVHGRITVSDIRNIAKNTFGSTYSRGTWSKFVTVDGVTPWRCIAKLSVCIPKHGTVGGERSAPRSVDEPPLVKRLVVGGTRVGLNVVAKTRIIPLPKVEPWSSSPKAVTLLSTTLGSFSSWGAQFMMFRVF
jgi:hypothetical protein